MEEGSSYTFAAFRLEPPPGGLWRGDVRLAVRPRSEVATGSEPAVCSRCPGTRAVLAKSDRSGCPRVSE